MRDIINLNPKNYVTYLINVTFPILPFTDPPTMGLNWKNQFDVIQIPHQRTKRTSLLHNRK